MKIRSLLAATALLAATNTASAKAPSGRERIAQVVPHRHRGHEHHEHLGPDVDPAQHEELHPEEPEERGLPVVNWFDFGNRQQPPYAALALNFLILLGIYYYFGRKPISAALKRRREHVAKAVEEAERIKSEAEARAKLYQDKLYRLEEELAATRQALLDTGKGERDRLIREAEEKAARIQRDAEQMIHQEFSQLRADLIREIVEVSTRVAGEMLARNVTAADHARIAEDHLMDLVEHGRGNAQSCEAS